MKEFRRRFVQLNMLQIGIVLLLMMILLTVYLYRDYVRSLQLTMRQVLEPMEMLSDLPEDWRRPPLDGAVPPEDGGVPPEDLPGLREAWGLFRDSRGRIMTVIYTPADASAEVISQVSLLEGDELLTALAEVAAADEPFGQLRGLYYYRAGIGGQYRVALAPVSYVRSPMWRLVGILTLVWAGAMLCLWLFSRRLSRLAVAPMERAMEREKQFVTDASHDLKTPLAVILANSSILKSDPALTGQRRWIESTEDAAKQMQQMIGQMLTLADVERPDAPLQRVPVDLSALATRAALQMEPVAYDKGVSLETELAEAVTLRADAAYLEQILAGLLENAIKYEPAGGTVCLSLSASRRHARLAVRNAGSAIAAEDLPHIFERFYRADKSRRSSGGHGLGLAITRQMVEALGGRIEAESPPDGGTVFTVTLPM